MSEATSFICREYEANLKDDAALMADAHLFSKNIAQKLVELFVNILVIFYNIGLPVLGRLVSFAPETPAPC